MDEFSTIVRIASILSPLLPIITGWGQRKVLWLYAWMSLIADIIGYFLHEAGLRHLWLSNLFFLLEWICFWHFWCAGVFSSTVRKQMVVLGAVVAFCYATAALIHGVQKSNYEAASVLYGIYVAACIFSLYKVLRDVEHLRIEHSPLFIVSAGLLLYSSGSLFVFLFKNRLTVTHHEFIAFMWVMRNLLNILKNVAISRYFVLEKHISLR